MLSKRSVVTAVENDLLGCRTIAPGDETRNRLPVGFPFLLSRMVEGKEQEVLLLEHELDWLSPLKAWRLVREGQVLSYSTVEHHGQVCCSIPEAME